MNNGSRDLRFDTLKGFLILSVVFGHFFLYDATHEGLSEVMVNFFYSFHMPLFVFVSGFFTKTHGFMGGGKNNGNIHCLSNNKMYMASLFLYDYDYNASANAMVFICACFVATFV